MRTKIVLHFLAILVGGWSADAAEVRLLPQSRAKGSLVLLGDVAQVKSTDAQRTEQLRRVELFPAPAQNRSKLMHIRELVELLILHGVDIDDLGIHIQAIAGRRQIKAGLDHRRGLGRRSSSGQAPGHGRSPAHQV